MLQRRCIQYSVFLIFPLSKQHLHLCLPFFIPLRRNFLLFLSSFEVICIFRVYFVTFSHLVLPVRIFPYYYLLLHNIPSVSLYIFCPLPPLLQFSCFILPMLSSFYHAVEFPFERFPFFIFSYLLLPLVSYVASILYFASLSFFLLLFVVHFSPYHPSFLPSFNIINLFLTIRHFFFL